MRVCRRMPPVLKTASLKSHRCVGALRWLATIFHALHAYALKARREPLTGEQSRNRSHEPLLRARVDVEVDVLGVSRAAEEQAHVDAAFEDKGVGAQLLRELCEEQEVYGLSRGEVGEHRDQLWCVAC